MLDTLHGCAVSWVPATCRLLEAFVICMIDWNRIIYSNAPDLFFLLYMRCRGLHNAQLPPCKFPLGCKVAITPLITNSSPNLVSHFGTFKYLCSIITTFMIITSTLAYIT